MALESEFLEKLVRLLGAAALREHRGKFEFSRYINGPRGSAGIRTFTYIQCDAFSSAWLEDEIRNLTGDEELALNSRFHLETVVLHIPMIDFVAPTFESIQVEKVRRFAARHDCPWLVADSGNSFHAYFGTLLSGEQWRAYLGELLLQTPPAHEGEPMPIDVRWVGHSLINGFSALRCSSRTPRYLHAPRYVTGSESLR